MIYFKCVEFSGGCFGNGTLSTDDILGESTLNNGSVQQGS